MPGRRASPLDPRAALARSCAALKVFPLPDVVVLPGTPAPFHVFEPRYRALVGDALRGDRILAVPTLAGQETPGTPPPLHPIAGGVVIEEEERLPDGRYHVLVRGIARVRLAEELRTGKAYREFRAEVLEDVYPAGGAAGLEGDVEALEQLVLELCQLLPPESGAPQLAEAATRVRDPGALADLIAAAAISEPAARLAVIEELDVARRLQIVMGEVAGVLLVLGQGKTPRA